MNLTREDKIQLQQLTRGGRGQSPMALRAKIVLACGEGLSNQGVGKQLGVSPSTVKKWRDRYTQSGIAGLGNQSRQATPPEGAGAPVAQRVADTAASARETTVHHRGNFMPRGVRLLVEELLRRWQVGLLIALAIAGYFAFQMFSDQQTAFLPGQTSAGHHQIEQSCQSCHTPFAGVAQEACLDCHGEDLESVQDSHGPSKFRDPRTFTMLAAIDATKCITCHLEHDPKRTGRMGVTVPADFCEFCHADIEMDRPSHKGMAINTCASAGCHNYHDNRGLYEDFLARHLVEETIKSTPFVPERDFAQAYAKAQSFPPSPLSAKDQDGVLGVATDPALVADWAASSHAFSGVNCADCHRQQDNNSGASNWSDKPGVEGCKECHENEVKGFLESRHGMRLAANLAPMTPAQARIPMKLDKQPHKELNCTACHTAHQFDTRRAAVKACLNCHNDTHSKAYLDSPHYRTWEAEVAVWAPKNSGVSCATCHLPRIAGGKSTLVQHNQSDNLRPNSKMIRGVCMNCHGLAFTLASLADPKLVRNNYSSTPVGSIKTLKMVEKRLSKNVRKRREKQLE